MRTRMTIIALALVAALATAAPAVAQNTPQQDAYGGVIAEVVTPSKPKPQQQSAAQQAPVAARACGRTTTTWLRRSPSRPIPNARLR